MFQAAPSTIGSSHCGPYFLSQLFVFGLQVLAVSAPGSVELDEDIFAVVIDDRVKVLSDHHLRRQRAPERLLVETASLFNYHRLKNKLNKS